MVFSGGGGQLGTAPDGVLRLQASHAGGRVSYLLALGGKCLSETHLVQCFSHRVCRDKDDKGVGKRRARTGRGLVRGSTTRRAAAPANPQG